MIARLNSTSVPEDRADEGDSDSVTMIENCLSSALSNVDSSSILSDCSPRHASVLPLQADSENDGSRCGPGCGSSCSCCSSSLVAVPLVVGDPEEEPSHPRRTYADNRRFPTTASSTTRSYRRQRGWVGLLATVALLFVCVPLASVPTATAAYDDYYGDDDDAYADGGGGSGYNNNQGGAYNGDNPAYMNQNEYYYWQHQQQQQQDDDDDGGNNKADYNDSDDDTFHWNTNAGFDGVSVMPVSCVNYNNGHMIKFQLFDTASSYQCHFAEISTFVVSISHYMRAYFNYQALMYGTDFELPDDVAYLNCAQLTTQSGAVLYGKIGCMERETFTSTKLQLRVYTDNQCSTPFKDGYSARRHANKGYEIDGELISTHVSFRPPFYSCLTCAPEQIDGTFNKRNQNWYDDDYINANWNQEEDKDGENNGGYGGYGADDYLAANDDVNGGRQYGYYNNNRYKYDDDADDGGRGRMLAAISSEATETYREGFWNEYNELQKHRSLYDNYYDIGSWNMCQRIYKYGIWCDEECRSLDFFRADLWSGSDIFLLSIMTMFISAMMLLIVAKRLKAQQKARIYGDDYQPMPGLPPFGMALIFALLMAVIITLAKLKFVNETLVFAVVTCILLFIYMLKLTLFENRRPVLLAAPKHDMFESPLDQHLFD